MKKIETPKGEERATRDEGVAEAAPERVTSRPRLARGRGAAWAVLLI